MEYFTRNRFPFFNKTPYTGHWRFGCVSNHLLSVWFISMAYTFRTSLILVLCLSISSAPLSFCVSINAFCSLGRGRALSSYKNQHTLNFVSIFVVLSSVRILRMILNLQLLLVALSLHEPIAFARFMGINMLITVNARSCQTYTHACLARGHSVTQTRCIASLSEIARAVQISPDQSPSAISASLSLLTNLLAVLASSYQLGRSFSLSTSMKRRRPPRSHVCRRLGLPISGLRAQVEV